MMRNPIVVLTDVDWVGFVFKFWLVIVLNINALVLFIVIAYLVSAHTIENDTVSVMAFIPFLGTSCFVLVVDGVLLYETGYWERRGK